MADKQKKGLLNFDLFDLPILSQIRRGWFWVRVRGVWGNEARTLFFLDLAEATRLGTPLDLALELIAERPEESSGKFDKFMMRLDETVRMLAFFLLPYVRRGLSLSQSMRRLNGVFHPQEVQIVAMGERLDMLPQSLKRLAQYRQNSNRLRRLGLYFKYPIVLATMMVCIVSGILVFIIPKYQDMFAMLGGELPSPTQFLLGVSNLFTANLYIFLFIIALVVFTCIIDWYVNKNTGFPLIYHLPVLNRLYQSVASALWMAAFTLGLESGASAHVALELAGAISGGKLGRRSNEAARLVEQGCSIGEACVRCKVLEDSVNHRLHLVDWRSNYISELRGILQDTDRRVTDALDRIGKRLEIISNVAVGIIIGFTVIALYLPLFKIPGLIKFAFT